MEYAIHTYSVRLANGEEALITRAVDTKGRIGYGYSLGLDATASRHMAQRNAGEAASTDALPEEIREKIGSLGWLPA